MSDGQHVMGRRVGLGRNIGHDPDHERARTLHPFRAGETLRTERFWRQDGAWLDQNGYGTCVAFALSHRMADKPVFQEQRHPDIFDPTNDWAFELYRAATGDESMQEGTWANIVARELLNRGLLSSFEWITNEDDLRFALLEKGPVSIGVNWYNSMFDPYYEDDGHAWIEVDPSSGLAGGHEFLLNAVRLEPPEPGQKLIRPFYRMKNSWGTWWGDNGTARIACDDVHRLIFEEYGDAIWLEETR